AAARCRQAGGCMGTGKMRLDACTKVAASPNPRQYKEIRNFFFAYLYPKEYSKYFLTCTETYWPENVLLHYL
ncbi:MAG: hypothetical protein AVDCRST_MAG56-2907, partial [uncultured Cytophagales bacterium]